MPVSGAGASKSFTTGDVVCFSEFYEIWCVTLPKPGDGSTRITYHNVPVDHHPPSQVTAITDHNYSLFGHWPINGTKPTYDHDSHQLAATQNERAGPGKASL